MTFPIGYGNDAAFLFYTGGSHGSPFLTDDSYHYNGGPYWGDLEDYIFIEKCPNPNCGGVLIRDYKKDKLICTLNRQEGCEQTKKINLDDYY